MASSTIATALCRTLSSKLGMPMGRVFDRRPSGCALASLAVPGTSQIPGEPPCARAALPDYGEASAPATSARRVSAAFRPHHGVDPHDCRLRLAHDATNHEREAGERAGERGLD